MFHKLTLEEAALVKNKMVVLDGLISEAQRDQWITFFCGGVPSEKLEWNGSLQEAYYLFNQLRIDTLSGHTTIRVRVKNRGLDWVKINKIIRTKYGKIHK